MFLYRNGAMLIAHGEQKIRIGELLSQDSADVVDVINRMLDGRLVHQQNEHLSGAFLSRLLQGPVAHDGSTLSSLNNLGCLADKLPEELDLRMLPHVPHAALVVSKPHQEELKEFVLAHTRRVVPTAAAAAAAGDAAAASWTHTVEIDAIAIARHIITHHTGGRPCLMKQKLRLPFLRRLQADVSSEGISADDAAADATADANVEGVSNAEESMDTDVTGSAAELLLILSDRSSKRDVHVQLLKASIDLAKFWKKSAKNADLQDLKFPRANDPLLQNVKDCLGRCSEADGLVLLDTMTTLVREAKESTPVKVHRIYLSAIPYFFWRLILRFSTSE